MEKNYSFGEQLVGLNFNPSGDPRIQKAKQLCAELADLVQSDLSNKDFSNSVVSELYNKLYNHTIGEILNAQMNVVKLLTFK